MAPPPTSLTGMSAGRVNSVGPVVLRQAGAVLVPVAVWVFCLLGVLDAVIEGSTGYAVRVAVVMATVAFAVWQVLASPCLVVERGGLRVVNPMRVHWIPFAALDDVRVRGLTALTVHHASGGTRTITSWNAPGVPRRYAAASAPVAVVIEQFRTAWERGEEGRGDARMTVQTSWRWSGLVLLALVGANIAIWLH